VCPNSAPAAPRPRRGLRARPARPRPGRTCSVENVPGALPAGLNSMRFLVPATSNLVTFLCPYTANTPIKMKIITITEPQKIYPYWLQGSSSTLPLPGIRVHHPALLSLPPVAGHSILAVIPEPSLCHHSLCDSLLRKQLKSLSSPACIGERSGDDGENPI
jgi:hypothetical protein